MGTFAIYNAAEFDNFIIEVDVFTEDNDGMGLVWAYSDTDRHYRVIMVNDAWPDPPIDGIQGPFMKLQKRFSDDEPWHELISVVKEDYVDYDETSPLHWRLEVRNGTFTFTREDGIAISGADDQFESGRVGLQLYAHQAEFDNFTVTALSPLGLDPRGSAAASCGMLKTLR